MNKADIGIKDVLITKEQLEKRISEMGKELTEVYAPSENKLLIITLLKGGAVFTSPAVRSLARMFQVSTGSWKQCLRTLVFYEQTSSYAWFRS